MKINMQTSYREDYPETVRCKIGLEIETGGSVFKTTLFPETREELEEIQYSLEKQAFLIREFKNCHFPEEID